MAAAFELPTYRDSRNLPAAMVERAQREPTVEEIVVALRETRRGRVPPFTVVDGPPGGSRAAGSPARSGKGNAARVHDAATDVRSAAPRSTEVANLRGSEIERLLAENARLNERVVFLLRVIEQEQTRSGVLAARLTALETDRVRASDVRAVLEAELRPVLLVLLRLLEKRHVDPAANGDSPHRHEVPLPPASEAAPHATDWVVDLDQEIRP